MDTILIANRGEIAVRIIRTCRKMGIKSVAVFSEADRHAPFVAVADLAVFIGESAPSASYLDGDKIIETAQKVGADAIHPGYGFLSENADFAKKCAAAGLIFIGPNAEAIAAMGSKSKAKALMAAHNVPIVPGYQGEDQSEERLAAEATEIGFPILLKATAGGGGKGMRIVENEAQFQKALQAAQREAQSAFGNAEMIVEKYIASGRHIEFQIFGDKHGNAVHLLERECTIQRRYQKVIEESPSPVMSAELRERMGKAAVDAAKALNYDNAGTVEFIYDDKSGEFYFLEVNTRLQVEHPVTEEVTGLDLVQMQIESAQGLPLSIKQAEVIGKGYALEVRLYAEDAANDFLPVTGVIERFEVPAVEGLRVETAVENQSKITMFYDPMIAKLIVWDKNRAGAHRKMKYVLRHLVCLGMTTNKDFLLLLLNHPDLLSGNYNTHFIKEKIDLATLQRPPAPHLAKACIAATLWDWQQRNERRGVLAAMPSGWRNSWYDYQQETFLYEAEICRVKYRFETENQFLFWVNDVSFQVRLTAVESGKIQVEIDEMVYLFNMVNNGQHFFIHQEHFGNITLVQKERFPAKVVEKVKGGFDAPMPAQIIKILVETGQKVKAGDGLIVLSSMKMENTICTEEDGVVEEIFVMEGASVEAGFLLLKVG